MSSRIDISGQFFGELEVLKHDHTNGKTAYWLCRCSCGKEKVVRGRSLRTGNTTSCGNKKIHPDKRKSNQPASNRKDLTGQKFNQLEVLHYSHTKDKMPYWMCKCDCGVTKAISRGNLLFGGQKDCGHIHNLPDGQASFNNLLSRYKRTAIKRKREFLLSNEEFRELTSQNCHYCGAEPTEGNIDNEWTKGRYLRNGVDRLDNFKGYTIDNCVPCCTACNTAKMQMTKEEYIAHCQKVIDYQSSNI